jgi:hypothetical protein
MSRSPPEIRSPLDLAIDETHLRIQSAPTQLLKKHYLERLTELVKQRNANRSAEEIAALEKAKGLR